MKSLAERLNSSIPDQPRRRVLFLVEGFTDIRFVTALSEVCELTIAVPSKHFHESGLDRRLKESAAKVSVVEIQGNRFTFQAICTAYLWRNARNFEAILSQELLRGSLSASIVGVLQGVPVAAYMCLAPLDYFRCRRERREIGLIRWLTGTAVIGTLMTVNGRLVSRCIALGPYLSTIAGRYCARVERGLYYGVDTQLYRPCSQLEQRQIRRRLGLPENKFVVFLSSRISHEKDPETVLRAVALARTKGLDAVVLNLSGGYQQFLNLAHGLLSSDVSDWVIARPAVHPMRDLPDYYRAADCVAQASLAEGLGMSPLEALASGVPSVCTAVGGLDANLRGHARLIPRCDPEAMSRELLWVAAHPEESRQQALAGRKYVVNQWSKTEAIAALAQVIDHLSGLRRPKPSLVLRQSPDRGMAGPKDGRSILPRERDSQD